MGARRGAGGAANIAIIAVGDPRDPRLADYRNIPDRTPDPGGLFVAEGRLVVQRLLSESRFPTRSMMVTEPALASLLSVVDSHPRTPVYVVPKAVRLMGENHIDVLSHPICRCYRAVPA